MNIAIMGDSGAGKTTSMRNLDPAHTMYIDADKKGLPWKGWKSQYNAANQNYIKTDSADTVLQMVDYVDKQRPEITTVVIDTINGIMVADEMRRSSEKGFDKWLDLCTCIYAVLDRGLTCRDDLNIIYVAHTQTDREDDGYRFVHIKTSGKKLDKIVPESKFPVVVLCKCVDGQHKFEIRANHSTAKVPMGAFPDNVTEIDNDITILLDALKDF